MQIVQDDFVWFVFYSSIDWSGASQLAIASMVKGYSVPAGNNLHPAKWSKRQVFLFLCTYIYIYVLCWYRKTLYRFSIDVFATSSCFVTTGNQRRCHLENTRRRRKEKRVVSFYNYACFRCWQLSIHLVLTFLKVTTCSTFFSCTPV